MRSIECLINQYPDKTGKEIIEIQNQDKIDDEKEYQKINEAKLSLIKDINENGGYYRGTFGMNQYFYYSFTNLELVNGKIYCGCEHIVVFEKGDYCKDFNLKIDKKEYVDLDKYGITIYERVTKEDFEKIKNYIENITNMFW